MRPIWRVPPWRRALAALPLAAGASAGQGADQAFDGRLANQEHRIAEGNGGRGVGALAPWAPPEVAQAAAGDLRDLVKDRHDRGQDRRDRREGRRDLGEARGRR